MTADWIAPEGLFDGQRLHTGLALRLEDGRVAEVAPAPEGARPLAGLVTPGYVDLQVNGGGGVLLNRDPSAEGMEAIAAAHRRFGTVAILPTVITDAPEVMEAAAEAAIAAKGREGLIGLHIEGPHIALARKGTHAPQHIRPLDEATLAVVEKTRAAGVPVLITLAPEAVREGQIARLAATGAKVFIGHSDATAEEARAALAEGAVGFTHLFNAMSQMTHRAPGVVGAAITSKAYAGIIADGHHVLDEMVALAIRARPLPDRMFLVSDAMPTVGGPDHFTLYGQELHLSEGRLVNAEGSLAGAHVTMADSVARLVRVLGLSPEEALRMAVTVPAEAMGLPDLARIEGRAARDVLVLDGDMQVTATLDGPL
ncbi:N-acetylglucosamine-6-phosphate deacetylase [Pseudoroseicyclus aestuarii]|uniref:N-acetylglucosamine 6-phosphate deacetylase n=1 Tax=Pseudoroseicyclus aestuarii TaxID=1795041 RepID=A0A318SS93_9RHOB|nr:N-acetylglucosamine-6-phosphate deacetylase [Pseudoroseicyclus aestuarii]PYE84811.1 N-acetylglucosamine 6-phosphate deacetylase [Pseudoroseicyclus aestuarii]